VRHRQEGQILVLFALGLLTIMAFVGLAVDGARLFQAHLSAQVLADEAANAAAQQLDISPDSALRRGEPPELVTGKGAGSAYAAADSYLLERVTDRHTRWSIEAMPREVDVTIERDVDMAFFQALGLGTQTVAAQGFATPLSGILSPDPHP